VRPRPAGTQPSRRPFPGLSPGAPAPPVPPATARRGPAARGPARATTR